MGRLPRTTERTARSHAIIRGGGNVTKLFNNGRAIRIPTSSSGLRSLGRRLVTLRAREVHGVRNCASDLHVHGERLGHGLFTVLNDVGSRTRATFHRQRRRVTRTRRHSAIVVAKLVITTVILLMFSCLVVRERLGQRTELESGVGNVVSGGRRLLRAHGGVVLAVSRSVHTPLGVVGNDTRLTTSAHSEGEQGHRLTGVKVIDERVLRLLGGLLSICHLGRSGRAYGGMPFDLGSLLRHVTANFSGIIGGGNVLFLRSFGSASIILRNSISHVRRVVSGLLAGTIGFARANAVRFGTTCGSNVLSVRMGSANVNVSRSALSHVFHPFRHLSSRTGTRNFKLNLPVAGKLIGLLNNAVSMGDRIKRKDAFGVSLPLPISGRRVSPRALALRYPSLLPRHMLIVSGSALRLRVTGRVLRHGNMLYAAYSGTGRLIGRVHGRSCSLLLDSVRVPRAGNFRVLTLLHGSGVKGSRAVPVITVATQKRNRGSTFVRDKFASYVRGPFSVGRLLSVMSSMISRGEMRSRATSFSSFATSMQSGQGLLEVFVARSRRGVRSLRSTVGAKSVRGFRSVIRRVGPSLRLLQTSRPLRGLHTALGSSTCSGGAIGRRTRSLVRRVSALVARTRGRVGGVGSRARGASD